MPEEESTAEELDFSDDSWKGEHFLKVTPSLNHGGFRGNVKEVKSMRAKGRTRPKSPVVTRRKYEIKRLFHEGKTTREIAEALGIPLSRVRNYASQMGFSLRRHTD